MKYFLLIAFAAAAFQGSLAEDLQANLDQLQKTFEDLGKSVGDNINADEVKETVIKKWEEVQQQMQHVQQDVDKYLKEHPESPVSQAAAKMEELLNDFKSKNPDIETNLKSFQQTAAQVGEKFTQQMKEAYEKVNTEGGLKDQINSALKDWSDKMKVSLGEIEGKIKEAVQQSQH